MGLVDFDFNQQDSEQNIYDLLNKKKDHLHWSYNQGESFGIKKI